MKCLHMATSNFAIEVETKDIVIHVGNNRNTKKKSWVRKETIDKYSESCNHDLSNDYLFFNWFNIYPKKSLKSSSTFLILFTFDCNSKQSMHLVVSYYQVNFRYDGWPYSYKTTRGTLSCLRSIIWRCPERFLPEASPPFVPVRLCDRRALFVYTYIVVYARQKGLHHMMSLQSVSVYVASYFNPGYNTT